MIEESKGRARAEGTVSFGVSAFPGKQWDEWNRDCTENFGDCRWIKMWHDHSVAKFIRKFEELEKRIIAIERALTEPQLQSQPQQEPKKNTVQTFGGSIKEGD